MTVQWAYHARTVRGSALVESRKEYVEAARCLGLSNARILFRHILPNCLPPLIVVVTVQTAHAISLEATLSFLGVGLPQTEPSLGLLISNGFEYMLSGDYWISFFPGLVLLLTIVLINLVGDQLRDAQPDSADDGADAGTDHGACRSDLSVEGLKTHFFPRRAWSRRSTACRHTLLGRDPRPRR